MNRASSTEKTRRGAVSSGPSKTRRNPNRKERILLEIIIAPSRERFKEKVHRNFSEDENRGYFPWT